MLNVNDKMDYTEDTEISDSFGEDTQNLFEFYNSNYNVNYFGAGRVDDEF